MTAKTSFVLIALFATSLVPALRAENDCTARTINGVYGFSGNGFDAVQKSAAATANSARQAATPGFAPVTFVGTLSFTGDGMVSGSFTANGNGHQEKADPFTGAYVVNADCTGLVAVKEKDGHESHFTVTITDGGKELLAMQTDDGSARSFVARKQ